MKRLLTYSLFPLLWLFAVITISSVLSYALLKIFGDIWPLHKLISKLSLILLLLSIFPLKRYLNFSWRTIGFAPLRRMGKQFAFGLLIGIATLLPVMLLLYALDVQQWDQGHNDWSITKTLKKTGLALLFAILIGIGEEILFRGILWRSLKSNLNWWYASLISAAYYAYLHFLSVKTHLTYSELSFASPWHLLREAFANWLNPAIYSAWLALFMVGIFLSMIRRYYPHSLALCIGCHAGWVWQIKLMKDLCNLNTSSELTFLVSSYDGVIGPLVSIWLAIALTMAWVWWRLRHTGGKHASRPGN